MWPLPVILAFQRLKQYQSSLSQKTGGRGGSEGDSREREGWKETEEGGRKRARWTIDLVQRKEYVNRKCSV